MAESVGRLADLRKDGPGLSGRAEPFTGIGWQLIESLTSHPPTRRQTCTSDFLWFVGEDMGDESGGFQRFFDRLPTGAAVQDRGKFQNKFQIKVKLSFDRSDKEL